MKNKNKGFTIVEIIVSLSIIVIVLALCSTLIMMVSNIAKKQEYEYLCQTEYQDASSLVEEFKNAYSTYQYTLYEVTSNSITMKESENDYQINYDENTKKLSAQIYNYQTEQVENKEITFKYLINISFVAQDNNVSCTYQFDNFHSYTNLLIFGAN